MFKYGAAADAEPSIFSFTTRRRGRSVALLNSRPSSCWDPRLTLARELQLPPSSSSRPPLEASPPNRLPRRWLPPRWLVLSRTLALAFRRRGAPMRTLQADYLDEYRVRLPAEAGGAAQIKPRLNEQKSRPRTSGRTLGARVRLLSP